MLNPEHKRAVTPSVAAARSVVEPPFHAMRARLLCAKGIRAGGHAMWTGIGMAVAFTAALASSMEPAGAWKASAPPGNEAQWRCANHARNEWRVQTDGRGEVLFAAASARRPEFSLRLPGGGRLVGIDKDEFGGSVDWVSDSGKERLQLLQTNPVAFTQYRGDVYIASGPSHLGAEYGHVHRMHRLSPTRWQIDKVLDLDEAPVAALAESEVWTLVTTQGVLRVDLRSFTATRMHVNPRWGSVYPNSVVHRHGRWYIGARGAVVRLSPSGDAYREEWMVPPGCGMAAADYCHCRE